MSRHMPNTQASLASSYRPDKALWAFALASLSALSGIAFLPSAPNNSLTVICRVVSVLAAVMLAINVRYSPRGIYSVSSVYLIVFSVFHFGLVVSFALDLVGLTSDFEEYILTWFDTPATCRAVVLAGIALASLVAGKTLAILYGVRLPTVSENDDAVRTMLGSAGAILLLASTVAWFYVIVNLARIDLLGSYESFYTTVIDFNVAHIEALINLGLVVTLLGPRSRLAVTALLAVGGWAIAVMLIGHRGAILFPLAGAIAVLGMKKIPVSPSKALVGAVVALSLIAAIRELRETGLRDADHVSILASPVNGLMEMGGSLRPVREAALWIQQGDEYSCGASFWAPFDRALYYVVPGWSRPPVELDERLLANVVEQRVGSIGFSNVAESYYNFGPWGMALEFLAIGFLLGRMDFWPARPHLQTIVGVCLIPLLVHVRNTFTPVPAQIILGLVFINGLQFLIQLVCAPPDMVRAGRGTHFQFP
jgi:hypothetical protein